MGSASPDSKMFLPWTNHSLRQALYIMKRLWMMYWKTCRLQTMYALLNAQMLGIYNETELSLSLRKQRTGEIKRNWNGLRWKSPRCFPARIDCLCYWKCLENPPSSYWVDSSPVHLGIVRTIFTDSDYFSKGSLYRRVKVQIWTEVKQVYSHASSSVGMYLGTAALWAKCWH